MARVDALSHSINELRRGVERAARAASRGGGNVNIARRRNVVVARNIGQRGSSQNASAVQTAPIRQGGHTDRDR